MMTYSWYYYIVRGLLQLLIPVLTRYRINGMDNIPRNGPVLIVSNHIHAADIYLLGATLSRKVIFIAKKELYDHRFIGAFLRGLGSFPVDRYRVDRKAIRRSTKVLAKGQALVIFPEGSRSASGEMQPAFAGAALIASHSTAPILPIGIYGTEQIKGLGWIWRRPRLTVNIGPTFPLPPSDSKHTRTRLNGLTAVIMQRIAALLPEEYQGDYGS